jgi:CubicO group peptidase (beta-lactamase class C family)
MLARKMLPWALSAALALALPADAAAQAPSADPLTGRWVAQKRFGPDAHGNLIIMRTGGAYSADMVGRTVPVRMDKDELVFDLPGGQGSFRGRRQGKAIVGHWYRPGTAVNSNDSASPVRLVPDGTNRWRGEVTPMQDSFTYYLLAEKRPDGSLDVVLRNPERDFGNQIGAQRLVRDGNALKLMGKRRREKDERVLAAGTFDAENQTFTLAFPDRGATYDFSRDTDDSEVFSRGKSPEPYVYHPPLALADGWPTATLEQVGIDRAGIEKYIQAVIDQPQTAVDDPQVHGLLIARHGKLVLEEYFHGYDRDRLHTTRSASKSVTATIVGAAMQAGAPLELSRPVYLVMNGGKFPSGLEPAKRAMTLENLLTMSSGFFCDDNNDSAPGNETTMWDQTKEPDFYRYYMAVPLDRTPGAKAVYCSGDPNLALGMVGRATGENPMDLFDRLIAGPMKISRYEWGLDPAKQPYGGGSTAFVLRDFIKFGQLMLNGGTWGGKRILSRDFVARASEPRYTLGTRKYGYLWWGEDFPYIGRTVYAFMALGAGGQTVMVFPELDLVMASFSGSFASQGYKRAIVPAEILPAVLEDAKAGRR